MCTKLALIFCLITIFVIGVLVFVFAQEIDFTTIFYCLKLVIPAGFVAYFGGYYLGKILQTAKAETNIIASSTQKQFVDDLLLKPEQVLNTMPTMKFNNESSSNETKKDEGQ